MPAAQTPPPLSRLALENLAFVEYSTLKASSSVLRVIPKGNGLPALVMPGFATSDRSTAALRSVLLKFGHAPHGWRLGSNNGPHPEALAGIKKRLFQLHERYGQQVSLVGWSLGGVYARELAREHPEVVRQVITLASPFRYRPGDRSRASALYDLIGPGENPFLGQATPEHERTELPVPSTSIYTRTDGIVRWHLCAESAGAVARERGGDRDPQRAGPQHRRRRGRGRPPGPSPGDMGAVPAAGGAPPPLPDPLLLGGGPAARPPLSGEHPVG